MARASVGREEKGRKKTGEKFYRGIFILTLSGILVKIVGLVYKIPLSYMMGDTGMGYYNSAYSVYTFFYMLSTSGLPVALSVLISEYKSSGKLPIAKAVYRAAMLCFSVIGAATFLFMLFGSGSISSFIRSEESEWAVRAVAPAILFISVTSALRGYFQGTGNMTPIAVSQLIEAVGKLVFGMLAASYAIDKGYGIAATSAYAILGLTFGSLVGAVYLIVSKLIRRDRDLLPDNLCTEDTRGECTEIVYERAKYSEILRRIARIALPVTLSAFVMSLTGVADTFMIQRVLRDGGLTAEAAATLYGNYTALAVPLFNLPPVLVYPIAYSIVPAISSALAVGDRQGASEKTAEAVKFSSVVSLPCALGMSAMAYPILALLFMDDSARLAAPLLSILAPSSFFVCLLAVTNSALQGCGRERYTVVSMLCGALVKLVSGAVLLTRLGIYGAPMSTFLCYATATLMNLCCLISSLKLKLRIWECFIRPLISAAACAVAAYLSYGVLSPTLGESIATLASIAASGAVYFIFLFLLGERIPDVVKQKLNRKSSVQHKRSKENRNEQRRTQTKISA